MRVQGQAEDCFGGCQGDILDPQDAGRLKDVVSLEDVCVEYNVVGLGVRWLPFLPRQGSRGSSCVDPRLSPKANDCSDDAESTLVRARPIRTRGG